MAAPACKTAKPEDGAKRWVKTENVWKFQIYRDGWKELRDQYCEDDSAKAYWEKEGFKWSKKSKVWLKGGKTPEEIGYEVLIEQQSPPSSSDEDDSDMWISDEEYDSD